MAKNPTAALLAASAPAFSEVCGERVYEIYPGTIAILELLEQDPSPIETTWVHVFEHFYAVCHKPSESARLLIRGREEYTLAALEWGERFSEAQIAELTAAVNAAQARLAKTAPEESAANAEGDACADPTIATPTGG